MSQQMNKLKFQ